MAVHFASDFGKPGLFGDAGLFSFTGLIHESMGD